MSNKIQIKRGLKANLPILDSGEPGFTTDTKEFFIGDGSTNIEFAKQADLEINNTQLLDMIYQKAGGTATVITVPMQTLVNGYSKTFVASANNSGAVTTINGKKLYKPGTTISPNLIAGKAYTVWYSSTGDCFFIKASSEGTTIAAHVLETDTFSNDSDTGIQGIMKNQPSQVNVLSVGSSGANKYFRIPNGGYLTNAASGYPEIVANATQIDANIISDNIKANKTICGVTGKASVVDTADATAVAADIVLNKTAYINGSKVSGQATIASLGGRKVANNTVTSSESTASFVRIDGKVEDHPYVTVSGLSFKPSFIWLKYAQGGAEWQVIYSNVSVANELYTAEVFSCGYFAYGQSSTPYIMKADAGSVSVYNGGFTLPVAAKSVVWTWTAYE